MTEQNNDGGNAQATSQTSMADLAGTVQVPDSGNDADQGKQTSTTTTQPATTGNNQQEMADFIAGQNKSMAELTKQVSTAVDTVTALKEAEQQQVLNKAVDNAIAKINTEVKGNEKLADAFLNSAYRNDPSFKKIFDNRLENPDAYDKALNILSDEWKAINENRIDPQVAENQRALQESQRGGGPVEKVDDNTTRLAKLPDGDFMREIHRLAQSG